MAFRVDGELEIRQQFGLSVLMIKRIDATAASRSRRVTGPDTRLREGDVMLVLGQPDQDRLLEPGIVREP